MSFWEEKCGKIALILELHALWLAVITSKLSETVRTIYTHKDKSFDPIELTDEVEITSKLRKALFLIDNKGDDLLLYQSVIWNRRRTPDVYNITIAPTMDCNFHCYYCFETPTKGLISNETIRRISKYISETKDASVVNLTWFGGEPLLAKKQPCMKDTKCIERYLESLISRL